ncbi:MULTISPECIES: LysR family transcriptional regulator [unclassified Variovorax]|uniref:LysR family transcriptional regulator n=1 Tax=unclassified Variovorax TaxID=663243 RepID=UPI001317C291|nr:MULTISPECIES: LysR family transcriptional regulator [unclassified Variovorax]VTU13573.1 Hca operon transcriptional activator [Variovorax sp. SRS16]VTU18570.1 Hca operon transcriptional activator [Variovorax sp. PBL-E5]
MELRHLRYFVVLAEELHFGRAARRLSISQPPLSVAIRQLEESVRARLFERNSKEVRLTPAGEALQSSARLLLKQAEEAALEARDVSQGAAGRLRIGFVGAMLYRGLPQALRKFQARHPAVRVTLAELNSGEQIAELLHDRLDLGFVHTSRMPAELCHALLVSEAFVACLPVGHKLARRRTVAVASLQGEPFVLFSRSASPDYHERILAICAGAGFRPEVRHEVRHWLSVVSLVSQGMGVALVPSALRHAALRGAVFRPLEEEVARSDTYGVWREGPVNAVVQGFLRDVRGRP